MELHSAPETDTCDVEDRTPHSAPKIASDGCCEKDRIFFLRRVYLILFLGSCLSGLGVLVGIASHSFMIPDIVTPLFLVATIVAYGILVIFHQRWPHNVISFLLFKLISFIFLVLLFLEWLSNLRNGGNNFYPLVTFIALQTISTTCIVLAFISLYLLLSKCQISPAWAAVFGAILSSAMFATFLFAIMPASKVPYIGSLVVKGIGFKITCYFVSLIFVASFVIYVIVDTSKSYQEFGRDEWVLGVMAVYVDIVLCVWHVLSCRCYVGREEELS